MSTPDPAPAGPRQAWRRLGRLAGPRLTRGNLLATLLTLVLGVGVVAQVRATSTSDLEDLRESDLVALLDDVTARADELQQEVTELEDDRDRLLGASDDTEAQEAAQARLDSYRILAGTAPVEGPGVRLVIQDPDGAFTPTMGVDLIQELRDAGAEAIQVGPVRVVASTWVGGTPGDLVVDGTDLDFPLIVLAIGDSHTLAGALQIPGGVSDSVRRVGGEVLVREGESLLIEALHEPTPPRYARPVPAEEGR